MNVPLLQNQDLPKKLDGKPRVTISTGDPGLSIISPHHTQCILCLVLETDFLFQVSGTPAILLFLCILEEALLTHIDQHR